MVFCVVCTERCGADGFHEHCFCGASSVANDAAMQLLNKNHQSLVSREPKRVFLKHFWSTRHPPRNLGEGGGSVGAVLSKSPIVDYICLAARRDVWDLRTACALAESVPGLKSGEDTATDPVSRVSGISTGYVSFFHVEDQVKYNFFPRC